MAYTPEAMLDFCEEKGLLGLLNSVSFANNRHFLHKPVQGKLIRKPDGIYARLNINGRTSDYQVGVSVEQYEQLIREKTPYFMELYSELDEDGKETGHLLLASGEKDETEEQVRKTLRKEIRLEFLRYTQTDTIHKLDLLLAEGQEVMRKRLLGGEEENPSLLAEEAKKPSTPGKETVKPKLIIQ